MRRRGASAGVLALCLLLSLAVNYGGLRGSLALLHRALPEPKEKVTYLDLKDEEERPPEPPEEEEPPKPPEPPKPDPKRPEPELDELEEPEEPEPEKEEPKPEPEPEPEPEPKPHEFVMEQLKMVEQPDSTDEKESPEDYDYLSNVNRDIQEQTRAEITNLQEDAPEQQANQLEVTEEEERGVADETKIAEVDEHKAQLAKEAPQVERSPRDQSPQQTDPFKQSLLAMRELAPRDHKIAQEEREALASEADDGQLAPSQEEQSSLEKRDQQARIDRHDKQYKFRISKNDLDAAFGHDAQAARDRVARRQSKKKGVWEESRERWQSPLENMVPEVKVGNQTALRSRKHPFARYIATIHRSIHERWAYGYLDSLDMQGRKHPHNDPDLWTRLEIVINADGTIDRIINVRHSGKTAFDAAAREIVWAAGPFPRPPSAIQSGNGKVYMHWAFHRDQRACGTFGAQPFILDNAGRGDRPDPNVPVRAGRGGERRRLTRNQPTARPGPEGPVAPSGAAPAVPPAQPPKAAPKPPVGESPAELAKDPAAKKTADGWLWSVSKGNVDGIVNRSGLPFYAGDRIVARTRAELREVLTVMSEEIRASGKPKAAKVFSAADLRRMMGSVPAGVREGEPRAYAMTRIGGDTVILLMERNFGKWRVIGLAR